jgi:hypothetical protein
MKGYAHHRDTELTEDYPKGKGFYFHPTGRYRLDEKALSSRSIKSENFFLCDLCVSVVKCFQVFIGTA